jgi:Glycosyl transferase 4-like domain
VRVAILTGDAEAATAEQVARELSEAHVIRSWRPPAALLARRSYEPDLGAVPGVMYALRSSDADIVHSFSHVLAWAALRVTRAPVVYTCETLIDRPYLVAARSRLAMMERVAREAAAITVPRAEHADAFERLLQRRPEVVSGVPELGRLYTRVCREH